MKKGRIDIVNLIGISLVIVAIVSAGGLYYTAMSYTDISETFASVSVVISEATVVRDNSTGQIIINAVFLIENPSDLDIDIYRIEYQVNAAKSSTTVGEDENYVGSGSRGGSNNTVTAGSMRGISISNAINPDTNYMDVFENAEEDGRVYLLIDGALWYRIAQFPEAMQKLDSPYFMGSVMVHDG